MKCDYIVWVLVFGVGLLVGVCVWQNERMLGCQRAQLNVVVDGAFRDGVVSGMRAYASLLKSGIAADKVGVRQGLVLAGQLRGRNGEIFARLRQEDAKNDDGKSKD